MSQGNSGYGTKTITVYNPENDDTAEVEVEFYFYYDPGVHTYPNGDPGYPPDSGTEIRDWKIVANESETDPSTWVTEELVYEAFDDVDIDFDDFDHHDDYDYDDYDDGNY